MPKQQIVLITGCTEGGIGSALCKEYARRGAKVYAGVRKLQALGSVSDADGAKLITPLILDVTNEESVETAVKKVIEESGHIDVLINNAGVNLGGGASVEVPLDRYRDTFEVNYFGLIRITQKVAIHMAKRRSGSIVNIGSVAAYGNLPFSAAYSSSKAAVHSLSDVLRIELAPLGIHVLCVAPGKIKSNFGGHATSGIHYPKADSPFFSATQAIEDRTNYSQVGKTTPAEELAHAIRATLDTPKWRRRAYLTYGEMSTLSWLLLFLPPFLRDRSLHRRFKLNTIGAK